MEIKKYLRNQLLEDFLGMKTLGRLALTYKLNEKHT